MDNNLLQNENKMQLTIWKTILKDFLADIVGDIFKIEDFLECRWWTFRFVILECFFEHFFRT